MAKRYLGEEYIDMISDWWKANGPVKGFAIPSLGLVNGEYKGASFDNDVHEIFKCLCETVLTRAFVHETLDGIVCYNCKVESNVITPRENIVNEIIVFEYKFVDSNQNELGYIKAFPGESVNKAIEGNSAIQKRGYFAVPNMDVFPKNSVRPIVITYKVDRSFVTFLDFTNYPTRWEYITTEGNPTIKYTGSNIQVLSKAEKG